LPAINGWSACKERIKNGKKVAEGFSYTSDNNPEWMEKSELQAWVSANQQKIGQV
jgi:hypothetical protein